MKRAPQNDRSANGRNDRSTGGQNDQPAAIRRNERPARGRTDQPAGRRNDQPAGRQNDRPAGGRGEQAAGTRNDRPAGARGTGRRRRGKRPNQAAAQNTREHTTRDVVDVAIKQTHTARAKITPAQMIASATETSGDFADLGLSQPLLAALEQAGFLKPTDIQRELIPPALAGRDCLGQARTGTGKTAAFTLPLLQRVIPGEGIQALVLVPTRELAAQVGEHVQMLSPQDPPRTLVVYGGTGIENNLRALRRGVDVVVGTPGRILDLIQRRALDLHGVTLAVLDEVDRMLDIGFREDIRRIMSHVASERQTIFVSATITDDIRRLAHGIMHEPVEINVSTDSMTVGAVKQNYMSVDTSDKFEALRGYLQLAAPHLAIVFTRTKRGATNVARKLERANVSCAEIHGGLAQGRRTRVLNELREGRLQVLVATDLASRGLDVTGVSHIVNYDIPADPSVYVHRIGRTARMGASGHALTLVTPEQGRELSDIERLINQELTRIDTFDRARKGGEPSCETRVAERSPVAPVAKRKPRVAKQAVAVASQRSTPREATPPAAAITQRPRTLGDRFPSRRRR